MSRPLRSRVGARLFDGEIYSFSEKFKLSAGHFSSMLLTVFITMLQLAFFYLVPYFLMLAFGHHEVDFFSVMAASAFVQLLSSAVPLPGGTGGAEGRLCIVSWVISSVRLRPPAICCGVSLRLLRLPFWLRPCWDLSSAPQREHPCALGSRDAQARPHASDALCAH